MIKINLEISEADKQKIKNMPRDFRAGYIKGMRDSMYLVEAAAKSRFGRAGELKVRTGHLRRSIRSGIDANTHGVVGWIGSNIVYARIHELGGVIKPTKAKYLKFQVNNKWVSKKQVTIPARPYLMPSITENIDKIKNIIRRSIINEVL